MASFWRRLMTLLRWLRDPYQKPAVTEEMDRRHDEIERRLRILSVDEANRAQRIVQDHR